MHVQRDFQNADRYRRGWLTIGNFDGVHRGHQSMLATLVARAREAAAPAVVMTFDPHPITLLRPTQVPPALSLLDHKLELFERHGIDTVLVYPTDQALLNLSAEQFFRDIVLGRIDAVGLVEGPNFFFGHGRAGNVQTLAALCDAAGRKLEVVPAVIVRDRMVSSSEVRSRIASGQIVEGVEMLGHPYRIRGTVGTGAARGRTIGFPTANLEGITTLLPPDGVYAGRCSIVQASSLQLPNDRLNDAPRIPDGDQPEHASVRFESSLSVASALRLIDCKLEAYSTVAAINIGPNPTFGEDTRKFEVHLLDFEGDLYGRTLDVDLLARVRDVVRFESGEALIQQLQADLAAVRGLANATIAQ